MLKLPIVDKYYTRVNGTMHKVFVIGQCNMKCKKCVKAEWYQDTLAKELWTEFPVIIRECENDKSIGADCIEIIGGTNNKGVTPEMLIEAITTLSKILPVCLTSWLPDRAYIHKVLKDRQLVKRLITDDCNKENRKSYELRGGVYYGEN